MWTNIKVTYNSDGYFFLTIGGKTIWLYKDELEDLYNKVGKVLGK